MTARARPMRGLGAPDFRDKSHRRGVYGLLTEAEKHQLQMLRDVMSSVSAEPGEPAYPVTQGGQGLPARFSFLSLLLVT
jgi:hypothetical protein